MSYAPADDSIISLCKSPSYKEIKTFFSSGQFIIKCNDLSKAFLKVALLTSLEDVKKWWKEDLGFFSNGDQDIFIYLLLSAYCTLKDDSLYIQLLQFFYHFLM